MKISKAWQIAEELGASTSEELIAVALRLETEGQQKQAELAAEASDAIGYLVEVIKEHLYHQLDLDRQLGSAIKVDEAPYGHVQIVNHGIIIGTFPTEAILQAAKKAKTAKQFPRKYYSVTEAIRVELKRLGIRSTVSDAKRKGPHGRPLRYGIVLVKHSNPKVKMHAWCRGDVLLGWLRVLADGWWGEPSFWDNIPEELYPEMEGI